MILCARRVSARTAVRLFSTAPATTLDEEIDQAIAQAEAAEAPRTRRSRRRVAELLADAHVRVPTKHEYTLIWLLGLGDTYHSIAHTLDQLLPSSNVRVVVPNAPMRPITLNHGGEMRAWYDIKSENRGAEYEDVSGVRGSEMMLRRLLEHETDILDGESHRIILGGFSMGAAMAMHVGYKHKKPLAGVMACSGYVLESSFFPENISEANSKTPLFSFHGEVDDRVPIDYSQRTIDESFSSSDVPVDRRISETCGHHLTDELLIGMRSWWLKRWKHAAEAASQPE